MKLLRYFFLGLIILTVCLQSPSFATVGFAEWEISTPGGNKVGNNDSVGANGRAIYNQEYQVYLDNIGDFGFADGFIIGESRKRKDKGFFLFNERTKKITYFSNKQQLCSQLKQQSLLVMLIPLYNYYVLKYLLLFLPGLGILSIGFYLQLRLPFNEAVDVITSKVSFLSGIYVLTVVCNIASSWERLDTIFSFLNFLIRNSVVMVFFPAYLGFIRYTLKQYSQFSHNIQGESYFTGNVGLPWVKLLIFMIMLLAGFVVTILIPTSTFGYFSC
ncbi:MAG: hypothetical protein VKL59_03225 [Nostocaceae cyanobacterium]|nr:hypothetical protein [Nostocaceae cyanobacterium]